MIKISKGKKHTTMSNKIFPKLKSFISCFVGFLVTFEEKNNSEYHKAFLPSLLPHLHFQLIH